MSDLVHCRIRRVRMKGGADVTVLNRPQVSELGARLMEHAREIAKIQGDGLTGFFVVGWDKEAAFSSGCRIVDGVTQTMLPSWIAEVARREVVTTSQIHEVMERDYVVSPPRPLA